MTTNANLPAKASDFFNLPTTGQTLVDQYNTCGLNWVKATEEDDFIAHCIKHTDALADALDGLMNSIGGGEKECGHEFSCICACDKAKAALSAYRGAL